MPANGNARNTRWSVSGKNGNGITKPLTTMTKAEASPPNPRASADQKAVRLIANRQAKLTAMANTRLATKASQVIGDVGQPSPKRICPIRKEGTPRKNREQGER